MNYFPANYLKIVAAGIVDAAVGILIIYVIALLSIKYTYIEVNFLFVMIAFSMYRLVAVILFEGTIGMRVFDLLYLNAEMEALTAKEKLLAACFVLYRGVAYYEIKRKKN